MRQVLPSGVSSSARVQSVAAALDAAPVVWHVSHAAARRDDTVLLSSAAAYDQSALWLFADDDAVLASVLERVSAADATAADLACVQTGAGRIADLYASGTTHDVIAVLHRALERALVAALLRSGHFGLQHACVVELAHAPAVSAPLALADLPRRSTRLAYRFALLESGCASYVVVSLHDVASLDATAPMSHALLPPDVYAERESRVMAALVSEHAAFPPALATGDVSATLMSSTAALTGSVSACDSSATLFDALATRVEARSLRLFESSLANNAVSDFCDGLARYVDPLLSARDVATANATAATAAQKRNRDELVDAEASKRGKAAALAASPLSPAPVRTAASIINGATYVPSSESRSLSFSIFAPHDIIDDDMSSSSSVSSTSSSSTDDDDDDDEAIFKVDDDAAPLQVQHDANAALATEDVPQLTRDEAMAFDVGDFQPQTDDAADRSVRPPKLHRQETQFAYPPPPLMRAVSLQSRLMQQQQQHPGATPLAIGSARTETPEAPTPHSTSAPSPPPGEDSPLIAWPTADSSSGHRWRQREQLALASFVPKRVGAGFEHFGDAMLVRAIRGSATERTHLRHSVDVGNAVLERLLYAPAPPPVWCASTSSTASLLSVVRCLTRVIEPAGASLRAGVGCSLGDALTAGVGGCASEALVTPRLRVGFRGGWLDVAPDVLPMWERCQFEPYSMRKDVRYFVVYPACPFVAEQVSAFMRELTCCYQSCNLGAHDAHSEGGGLVPVDVGGCTSRADYVRAARAACDRLAERLAKIGATRVNGGTVVYVVDPFASDAAQLFAAAEAQTIASDDLDLLPDGLAVDDGVSALTDALVALLLEDERQPAHNVVSVVLPLADVLHAPILSTTLRDIAFGTYQACRRILLGMQAAPASTSVRTSRSELRESMSSLNRFRISSDPPYAVTPIDWRRRRLWEPLVVLAPSECDATTPSLHCCYSVERGHLFAGVCDATGELLETIVLPFALEAKPCDTETELHYLYVVFSNLWNALLGLVAVAAIRSPSLSLYSIGEMPDGHTQLWQQLIANDPATSPYAAVALASLCVERNALVYCRSGGDPAQPAVTAPPASVVFLPQAGQMPLPAVALLVHSGSDDVVGEGRDRGADWPRVQRVTLLHRWFAAGTSSDTPHSSLSKLCQQLARLSWLSVTARCGGGRQTTLPLHVAVLQRLSTV
jgi:hypothetical protein